MKKQTTFNNIKNRIFGIFRKKDNSMSLPNQYLKYGNRKMMPNWSDVEISDRDLYTGYSYAAIRNRANKTAQTAIKYVYTDSNDEKIHPYLGLIQTSKDFSEYAFWHDISTYLDLEGIYYLMAVRSIIKSDTDVRVGGIKYFKLLNPYNIKRVLDKDGLNVVGYIETQKGQTREIPPEMVIEIRELNPFDSTQPFAMTDALKENQFTIKTAGDYTRHSLKHNINASGILTTDVILGDKEFDNFVERVRSHVKGEPIFGNGSGSVDWKDMNIDLSKAALKDTNEINREALFAISGVSKTIMGIEQSGVTRETGKVQTDINIEYQILPRIQLVIDALNLDYRNNYENEYISNEYRMMVQDPTVQDYDKELKAIDAGDKRLDLYQKLLDKGYDEETAAKYANDEIDVDALPVVEKQVVEDDTDDNPDNDEETNAINKLDVKEKQKSGLVQQQQGALQNAVVGIETEVVAEFINSVQKMMSKANNSIEDATETDYISESDKNRYISELGIVLAGFYGIVMQWKGNDVMRDRMSKYALSGTYSFDKNVKSYIKEISKKVSISHINTITDDLYKIAYEAAKKGLSQTEIINEIKNKYSQEISKTRAEVVARTETNRAFTESQYQADIQFVAQNDLQGKAFKKWHTRSTNPCEFCQALEREGMIPFDQPFRKIGETVTVGTGKKQKVYDVDFQELNAGNLHTNCSCEYELVIMTEKNQIQDGIKQLNKSVKTINETSDNLEKSKKLIKKANKILKDAEIRKLEVDKKEKEVEESLKELNSIV
jgi:hypothetical protein